MNVKVWEDLEPLGGWGATPASGTPAGGGGGAAVCMVRIAGWGGVGWGGVGWGGVGGDIHLLLQHSAQPMPAAEGI